MLTNTIYGFIIVENIRDVRKENVKDTDTPFQPSCEVIEFDHADGSFRKPNDQERLNVMFMFPAFSEKEIGITISIPKPDPQKVFTDVKNNILPSKEPNIQIREIREQLTSTSHSDIITCEGKVYIIEVENGKNTANYYLYFPDEYRSFTGSLKQSLLEICKRWNDTQHKKAVMELKKWEQKNESFEQIKRVRYFKDVIGLFDAWYYENGLDSTVKTPFGFKPAKGKPRDINFDKDIKNYIKYCARGR